jgi:hypothetical protein
MVRTLLELGADCEREGVVKFDGHVIEGITGGAQAPNPFLDPDGFGYETSP